MIARAADVTAEDRVTILSSSSFPRARELTDVLLAPTPLALSSDGVDHVRRRLLRGIACALGESGRPAVASCVRVGAYQLRGAQLSPCAGPPVPFRWSALTARRVLGLAAVRAGVEGSARTPADAVALVMDEPHRHAGVGRAGAGSCRDWLGSLSRPARALVQAEATTWATHLWTSVEWRRLDPSPIVGPPDRWWELRREARISVRGRADVRFGSPGGPTTLLTVLAGVPGGTSRMELLLAALVDALRDGPERCPSRVVGWWPDCGKAWIVPVHEGGLVACAGEVVRAVEGALSTGSPSAPPSEPPPAPGAAPERSTSAASTASTVGDTAERAA